MKHASLIRKGIVGKRLEKMGEERQHYVYRKPGLSCQTIYIFFIAVLKLLFEVGI